eukprot:4409570-Amphidinium_carterae.1
MTRVMLGLSRVVRAVQRFLQEKIKELEARVQAKTRECDEHKASSHKVHGVSTLGAGEFKNLSYMTKDEIRKKNK